MLDDELSFDEIKLLLQQLERKMQSGEYLNMDIEELEIAIDYYIEGDQPEKALEVVNMALDANPNEPALLVKKAMIISPEEFTAESIPLLEKATVLEPSNQEYWLLLAEAYEQRELPEKALEVLEQLEAMQPLDSDAVVQRAELLYDLDRQLEAIQLSEDYLLRDLEDHDILGTLLLHYVGAEMIERGIAFCNLLTDKDPYCTSGWWGLGYLYTSQERYDKAVGALEYAYTIDEKHTLTLKYLANGYRVTGQFELALPLQLKLCAMIDNSTDYLFELADVYIGLEMWDEAKDTFKKMLELEPQHMIGLLGLGTLYADTDEPDQAMVYLNQLVEVAPQLGEAWYYLGHCWLERETQSRHCSIPESA